MTSERILRIARSDSEDGYVLVHISSVGALPLDLKLLATEGESPYVLNIKQSCIQELRTKTSQLDETQWEKVLRSVLLQRSLDKRNSETNSIEKVEVSATVAGKQLAIIIRMNISGITQRLGEILLRKDDTQEIDFITWTATAVMHCTSLEEDIYTLREKYEEQIHVIEKLNQQLEELINAKIEHESLLLEKFRDLLNAKKLKIRDQQRLLASTNVNPNKVIQPSNARSTPGARRTTKGLPKRKASRTPSVDASESNDDGAFENVSINHEGEIPPTATPERSDLSETEDEDEDDHDNDDNLDSVPVAQSTEGFTFGKPSRVPVVESPVQSRSLPPRRELPFPSRQSKKAEDPDHFHEGGNKASHEDAVTRKGGNDEDEDETSDDEL